MTCMWHLSHTTSFAGPVGVVNSPVCTGLRRNGSCIIHFIENTVTGQGVCACVCSVRATMYAQVDGFPNEATALIGDPYYGPVVTEALKQAYFDMESYRVFANGLRVRFVLCGVCMLHLYAHASMVCALAVVVLCAHAVVAVRACCCAVVYAVIVRDMLLQCMHAVVWCVCMLYCMLHAVVVRAHVGVLMCMLLWCARRVLRRLLSWCDVQVCCLPPRMLSKTTKQLYPTSHHTEPHQAPGRRPRHHVRPHLHRQHPAPAPEHLPHGLARVSCISAMA